MLHEVKTLGYRLKSVLSNIYAKFNFYALKIADETFLFIEVNSYSLPGVVCIMIEQFLTAAGEGKDND